MSHPDSGDPTWQPTITIPDDADPDPRDASSVSVPLEALADRTQYLYQRTALGAITVTSINLETPLGISRQVPLLPAFSPVGWSTIEGDAVGTGLPLIRYYVASVLNSWLLLPLASILPLAATLTAFSAKVAATSSASSLPGTTSQRMRAAIMRQRMAETDDSLQYAIVGSAVNDASASLANYQAIHFINGTSIGHVVAEGYVYYLAVRSDINGYGALYQATVTFTASNILPGGA